MQFLLSSSTCNIRTPLPHPQSAALEKKHICSTIKISFDNFSGRPRHHPSTVVRQQNDRRLSAHNALIVPVDETMVYFWPSFEILQQDQSCDSKSASPSAVHYHGKLSFHQTSLESQYGPIQHAGFKVTWRIILYCAHSKKIT